MLYLLRYVKDKRQLLYFEMDPVIFYSLLTTTLQVMQAIKLHANKDISSTFVAKTDPYYKHLKIKYCKTTFKEFLTRKPA